MCKARTVGGQLKDANNIYNERDKIKDRLKELEFMFPENDELQEYIRSLKRLEELDQEEADIKSKMVSTMPSEDLKSAEFGRISVTYVGPTTRYGVDVKKFMKDYGPDTDEYKKYVTETTKSAYVLLKEIKKSAKSKKKLEE